MNSSDSEKADVWLSVSFDADQYGRALCWTATEGRTNLYATYGKFAGSLHLPTDCGLRVEVHGYGNKTLQSFQIQSVCLVTVPADSELGPSPFVGQTTASVVIDDFPLCDSIVYDPHIGRAYGIAASQVPLQIGSTSGAWQVSMILTVLIVDGAGKRQRVFGFDPESQVGNGTR